ncbi:MAG TPA: PadR family transcriptional regulator [Dehalococcoidia bacterium]|nr:PadR family transcriptional regulator [Dehalococcoidia bacterium]
MRGEALKGHLDLILLLSLQPGPAYGYALIKELRDRTEGMLDLSEGTVYPVLHRLEEAGFLESKLVTAQSRRRRLYSITPRGEQELQRLMNEWDEFVRGIRNLSGQPPGNT